jgi:hypothetical protein
MKFQIQKVWHLNIEFDDNENYFHSDSIMFHTKKEALDHIKWIKQEVKKNEQKR